MAAVEPINPSPTSFNPPSPPEPNAQRTWFQPHFDLGVRQLLPRWRALGSPAGLQEDVVAGVTVALVAVPLSLAIALASGVSPEAALIASIVGGVVCALFAGTELAVTGPAAALSVLTATIALDHGFGALLFVGLIAGLLQLATGMLGLGRLVHYVPVAVVHGFTAGIGVIIMMAQLPRAIGMPAPDQHHVFDVIEHLSDYVGHIHIAPFALASTSAVLMLLTQRLFPRSPSLLFAVALPTIAAITLELPVEALGTLPSSLPHPSLPIWPSQDTLSLLADAVVVYAIASLETLLSSSAIDKMTPADRSDHNQEIISQGLGNVLVSLLGGIVVSGVVFRSSLNVAAGARTRRAAIIHALTIVAVVYALGPWVERIPVAVLAGVLMAFGARMVTSAPLRELMKVSRVDGVVMVFTTIAIVVLDLAAGVQYGVIAALVIAAIGLGRPSTDVHADQDEDGVLHVSVAGPLTFLAAGSLDELRALIARMPTGGSVVFSLGGVTSIDASGAECIVDLVRMVRQRRGKTALLGLRAKPRRVPLAADASLQEHIADQVADAERIVGHEALAHSSRLLLGVRRFHRELRGRYEPLLLQLGRGQKPHTLFITCADSRISPGLLTGTDPGELFLLRNIGNMVPPYGNDHFMTEIAGVEYAIGVLGVQEIVVCGHSSCGAVKALLGSPVPPELSAIASWGKHATEMFGGHGHADTPDDGARANVCRQLEHLLQYPIVKQRMAEGRLRLHGWFYNVGTGEVSAWNPSRGKFEPIGRDTTSATPSVQPLPEHGRATVI